MKRGNPDQSANVIVKGTSTSTINALLENVHLTEYLLDNLS